MSAIRIGKFSYSKQQIRYEVTRVLTTTRGELRLVNRLELLMVHIKDVTKRFSNKILQRSASVEVLNSAPIYIFSGFLETNLFN